MTWKTRTSLFGMGVIVLGLSLLPAAALSEEVYDLLFKTGTLDEMSRDAVLDYRREVSIRENDALGERSSGTVRLTFAPEQMAELEFRKDGKHRKIGEFPATVGNPMIMYFVETTIRDMAGTAGGSPYYIRNRVKAALLQSVPVETETVRYGGHDVAARSVTLHPFEDDPNIARMRGFGDLELTVVMSDDVPGWYYSLTARAQGNEETPAYISTLVLEPVEKGQ